MKVQQRLWSEDDGWEIQTNSEDTDFSSSLVLAFGNRFSLENKERYEELKSFYPNSDIIMNSTSGEILNDDVYDDSITVSALKFEKTTYKIVTFNSVDIPDSNQLGRELADSLPNENLKHVIVISDGATVNGSELVLGVNANLPESVTVTGGLAGDGDRFEKTLAGYNEAPGVGNVIGIGLYGDDIKIGYGSFGGWDSFGLKRKVTKSDANVLYELDGNSALDLYKKYLGDKAKELPGSALLFPLSIQLAEDERPLVRTILSIDEEKGSMTFAGDMPVGASTQLMKANFDKLVDGAYEAASSGKELLKGIEPEFALLVSCVGRKIVLKHRVYEEVESVSEVIGENVPKSGFYSYGEIAPFAGLKNCELHNQTMTITLFSEK